MPGCGETIATSRRASALISVDLPSVRRPGNGEHQALAKTLAAPVIVEMRRDLRPQRREIGTQLVRRLGRQVLVREIDERFLRRQQHE